MKIQSSSKIWAVLFSSVVLAILGYYAYNFYFPKQEVIEINEEVEPTPTPVPFRWDLYLDAEEATESTEEAKVSKPKSEEVKTTKGDVVEKSGEKEVSTDRTTETTITTTTSTNNNGEKTTETKTYTTTDENIYIEVKAEAHASAQSSN